jgi:hypothetical protein
MADPKEDTKPSRFRLFTKSFLKPNEANTDRTRKTMSVVVPGKHFNYTISPKRKYSLTVCRGKK